MESIDCLLLNESEFAEKEQFYPGEELKELFSSMQNRILVLGAGGLGCEIVKNLILSGFRHIDIIDLDRIELTNLNRQFLFNQKDIGRFKAEVVAEKISKQYESIGVIVNPHNKRIQDMGYDYYAQFPCIISGLDNVEARRFINLVLHQLVQYDHIGDILPSTQRILIDGGTEGLNGQARVIIPYKTSCYECSVGDIVERGKLQMCTIQSTPRQIEHCIAYVQMVQFGKDHQCEFNPDNMQHLLYVLQHSINRANLFSIDANDLDLSRVLSVVKNIIPAVASTNALFAAILVEQAVKVMAATNKVLNNYFMYLAQVQINSQTFQYQTNPQCVVCSTKQIIKQ